MTNTAGPPAIPLADQAAITLARLARITGSARIAAMDGAILLGERAACEGLRIPGRSAAGGGCRLHPAMDGEIALNLARPDDRALLPALFADGDCDPADDAAVARRIAGSSAAPLVARGRELGLAIAHVDEAGDIPLPGRRIVAGPPAPPPARAPRVLDLAALWAGPLAAHLLWLAGAEVTKIESRHRPDAMRDGSPAFFARLNQGKRSAVLDLRTHDGIAALHRLIAMADIVVEAARPRALAQLGVDADGLVRARPGLVWITITGHGATGDAARNTGFGDDCGVAAGLGAALHAASGRHGFVGDAIADPLTGLRAAEVAWGAWRRGEGGRYDIALVQTAREALRSAETQPDTWRTALRDWAAASGCAFPPVRDRSFAPVTPFGADTAACLAEAAPC